MGDKVTAFVSHSDCARHDTGWGHPDHQGRLPAVMRAVYRDMLDLHEPLLDLEGRRAEEADLLRFHTAEYLAQAVDWVEQARQAGKVIEPVEDLRISDATWDATRAAVGSVLTAIDAVLDGDVRNAFCATRPAGSDAAADKPGRYALANPIATAIRYLAEVREMDSIAVLDWRHDPSVGTQPVLPEGAVLTRLGPDLSQGLESLADTGFGLLLLIADFSDLSSPVGDPSAILGDVYSRTEIVRDFADRHCDGLLVSVLDHGYDDLLGAAVVQHLRALIGLPPTN